MSQCPVRTIRLEILNYIFVARKDVEEKIPPEDVSFRNPGYNWIHWYNSVKKY